jgi:hypothetical protein
VPFPYLGIFTADDSGYTLINADEEASFDEETAVPFPYLGIFTADDSGYTLINAD